MWDYFYVFMCVGDVVFLRSVRSRDLIVIVDHHLSEGVSSILWFIGESFESGLISAIHLSYNEGD